MYDGEPKTLEENLGKPHHNAKKTHNVSVPFVVIYEVLKKKAENHNMGGRLDG